MRKRAAKAKPSPPPEAPAAARLPRPTKAQLDAERFPNVDRNPMLHRALVILRAMEAGKPRGEAEAAAERKVGPRAPRWLSRNGPRSPAAGGRLAAPQGAGPRKAAKAAKPARGKRPEPERRMRVRAPASRPVQRRT